MANNAKLIEVLREIGRRVSRNAIWTRGARFPDRGSRAGPDFSWSDEGRRKGRVPSRSLRRATVASIFREQRDGGWVTLQDVDLILYVRRLPGRTDQYEAQMYAQGRPFSDAFDQKLGRMPEPPAIAPLAGHG